MAQKAGSLRKINKIHKLVAKLTEKLRDNLHTNRIRNDRRDITESEGIQRSISCYFKSPYNTNLEYLKKMDYFLDRFNL